MEKQEVMRDYNFSDSILITKGLEKVAFMQRDSIQFIDYGIENTDVQALETKINDFANRITDIEALGDQTQITADKDAKAEKIRVDIRKIMSRVVLVYPENSSKYKKFGTAALAHQSDPDLLITAKRVSRVGDELITALATTGLKQEMLDDLASEATQFADLIVELKIEIGERDDEQETRVEAGNEIYKTLAKYCKTGQSIWETTNVAKYNDYVIYNTISGEPEDETPPTP